MRLIDADAIPWTDLNSNNPNSDLKVLVTFAEKVNRMPTIEQPHWIPCSDKLPVEGNNVLLSDDLNVTIGRLIYYTDTGYKWEVDYWDCDLEVWQAWMPLPEPARLEGE